MRRSIYGRQIRLKVTGTLTVWPLVSATVIVVLALFVFVAISVAVKTPLLVGGLTVSCDGLMLTAVKVVTPGSLAVNCWEKELGGHPLGVFGKVTT